MKAKKDYQYDWYFRTWAAGTRDLPHRSINKTKLVRSLPGSSNQQIQPVTRGGALPQNF